MTGAACYRRAGKPARGLVARAAASGCRTGAVDKARAAVERGKRGGSSTPGEGWAMSVSKDIGKDVEGWATSVRIDTGREREAGAREGRIDEGGGGGREQEAKGIAGYTIVILYIGRDIYVHPNLYIGRDIYIHPNFIYREG